MSEGKRILFVVGIFVLIFALLGYDFWQSEKARKYRKNEISIDFKDVAKYMVDQ